MTNEAAGQAWRQQDSHALWRGKLADPQAMRSVVVFFGIVCCVAVLGGLAPMGEWYAHLIKPRWMPPGWAFGAAWTPLYVCIAFAGWKLWRSESSEARRISLWLWAAQMMLNALWSPLFFGLHQPLAALVDILLLNCVLAASFGWFRQVSPLAAWLFVPYALWIVFATALNAAIVMLN